VYKADSSSDNGKQMPWSDVGSSNGAGIGEAVRGRREIEDRRRANEHIKAIFSCRERHVPLGVPGLGAEADQPQICSLRH